MSSNNNLPQQPTEHYVKLDDHHHDDQSGVMYSSIDTTMSGSVYQQQQPSSMGGVGSSQQQGPPLVESTMMTNNNTTPTTTTTQQAPPSRGILDTVNDSLSSLYNSMTISSTRPNNNAYLQPQYNSVNVENPQTVYEYTLDSGILDCQLVHPTVLGQANWRITFEMIIQHKTIPNLTQKINKNEIGGSATYRTDLKVHVTALDKTTSFSERIETLVNSDPQKSLQNFFIYVIVKKTKVNLLDVQKTPIAYSPCFTLGDFLKTGNDQQQPMYSFDLFKDQQLREHVGKLGVRLSISTYSDYQYITSLPSGFFASKAFTIQHQLSGYTIKSQKVTNLLALTEKVKKWLNSHSSLIKVVDISSADDGKEMVQIVLYQKL